MTFEFLVACRMLNQIDVQKMLSEALSTVLENNLNEFDENEIIRSIQIRHWRGCAEVRREKVPKGFVLS